MKHVTVRMNTHAIKCDVNGRADDSNIRPNVYYRDTPSEVVNSGFSWHTDSTRGMYAWFVVKYGQNGLYSFVTQYDIV